MRFAIISNFSPVMPTGQAIVLHRLLGGLSPDQYYIISSVPENTEVKVALPKLNTKYYYLDAPLYRHWTSPWDMAQRAYRRFQGPSGQIENFIHLRARQICEIMRQDPCCALVACTSDLIRLPSAAIACAESAIPFVPYIFDDYAYHLVGLEREIAQRHDKKIMKQAAQVIMLNEAMAEEYQRRYHISNTAVVHNPTNVDDLENIRRFPPVLDKSTFNIVFSGSLYHAHYDAFRNIIQALERLPKNTIKLHLFTDRTPQDLAAEGISGESLVCHSYVPHAEMLSILLEADLLFLPLAFQSPIQDMLRLAFPSKTGDYLSMAKPILVHAPADDFISQYFRRHECGLVVDQPDIPQLAQVILDVVAGKIDVQTLGRRARQLAETDFAIGPIRARFIEAIQKAC
jgi:glycosyltransferase involved in cell wall biosynthesis